MLVRKKALFQRTIRLLMFPEKGRGKKDDDSFVFGVQSDFGPVNISSSHQDDVPRPEVVMHALDVVSGISCQYIDDLVKVVIVKAYLRYDRIAEMKQPEFFCKISSLDICRLCHEITL